MTTSTSSLITENNQSQSAPLRYAIGLDIGGTKISAAKITTHAGIVSFEKTATPTDGRAFVGAILELIDPFLKDENERPECIGIASAGTVNSETGVIFGSTGNLPALRQIGNLKDMLEKASGLPVVIENDANAAAYGEVRAGAAKGYQDVLMVTLGTGVGTGFIINNQLVRGAHYSAGEGGHIAIATTKTRLCTCGRWDCWEAYASGTGFTKTAQLLLEATPNAKSSLILQSHKPINKINSYDVISALQQADNIAEQVVEQWHQDIAIGLGSLLNVLDPEVVVVGGGMMQVVDFNKLTELTQERAMYRPIKIVPAVLENKAGLVGAAYLSLERTPQVS